MTSIIGKTPAGRRRLARYLGVAAAAAVLPAALLATPAYASGTVTTATNLILVTLSANSSHTITVGPPNATTSVRISGLGETLTAGAGCVQSGGDVVCPVGIFTTIQVNGGDRPDTITKTANARGDLRGGAGDDTINAGPSPAANLLSGGPGRDVINGGVSNDVLVGGTGSDSFVGGLGNDVVEYFDELSGVTVTLDGIANDGILGAGDNIFPDVETIYGSDFADTLTGNSLNNFFLGFAGNDRLNGAGGDDSMSGSAGVDTLRGEGGNDFLDAVDSAGGELVDGDIGFDTCRTDAGDNRLSCEA